MNSFWTISFKNSSDIIKLLTEKLKELVVEAVIRLKSKQVKLKIEEMLKQMKNKDISENERIKFMNDFQKLNHLSMYIDKELGREC